MKKDACKRSVLIGLAAVGIVSLLAVLVTLPACENIIKTAEGPVGGAYSGNAAVPSPAVFKENWGDVDRNGTRDSTDARLVLQFSVKKITASALLTDAADVDGDGTANSTDARLILQYAVKKISAFPVTQTVLAYAVQNGLTEAASEAAWLASLLGTAYTDEVNIVGAYVNDAEHLILKLSDGTTVDAGFVGTAATSAPPTTTTSTTTSTTIPSTAPTTSPTASNFYTVTFKDHDGTVLESKRVEKGDDAVPPQVPYRNGYIFTGWDANFANVLCDLTITAEYRVVTAPVLAATNVWAKPGESVEVPVTIHNNPGIAGARIVVQYDERLSLVTAKNSTALAGLDYTAPATLNTPCPFNWDSLDAVSTANGAALLLTFKVPANAVAGDTLNVALTYRKGDIYNGALDDVDLETVLGSITVY